MGVAFAGDVFRAPLLEATTLPPGLNRMITGVRRVHLNLTVVVPDAAAVPS